jgi:hypothetical protein
MLTLPLHPFLLTGAVAWRLRRAPRLYPPFLAAAVPVFVAFCARTYGEIQGYWRPGLPEVNPQASATAHQSSPARK